MRFLPLLTFSRLDFDLEDFFACSIIIFFNVFPDFDTTLLLVFALSKMLVLTTFPKRIKQVDRTQESQVMSE